MNNYFPLIWLAAIIVFALVEASTVQMISIWLALGAVAAFFVSFTGIAFYWQLLIFCVVSGVLLAATRPLVKKLLLKKTIKTNADRVVGESGMVLETVDNLKQTGRVSAMGLDWAARTADGSVLPEGTEIEVLELSGVTLTVKEKQPADIGKK